MSVHVRETAISVIQYQAECEDCGWQGKPRVSAVGTTTSKSQARDDQRQHRSEGCR